MIIFHSSYDGDSPLAASIAQAVGLDDSTPLAKGVE